MAQQQPLKIYGNTFVLTGRMWMDRARIAEDIERAGGAVAKSMRPGCILIMAASQLSRDRYGKWHTIGKATAEAETAMKTGALIYHEEHLKHALAGGAQVSIGPSLLRSAVQVPAPKLPEWNDDMQAKLDVNLRETAELLASF